jgi:DNA-3-methyladenine glycosylase II
VPVAAQTPEYWSEACAELCVKDPVLAKVIKKYPEPILTSKGDLFSTLIRSIVGQQISVLAADAVWGRFSQLIAKTTPNQILKQTPQEMKDCGLSNRKVEYIRGIAETWTQEYAGLDWCAMSDVEVKRKLIALRGVGPWTAEMILMFSLLRPDIFPIDDIGAIRAIENIYNGGEVMSKEELQDQANNWAPWRTVATWFLWRTIDDEPVEY